MKETRTISILCVVVLYANATMIYAAAGSLNDSGTVGSNPSIGNGQTTNTQIADPATGSPQGTAGTNYSSSQTTSSESQTSTKHHHHTNKTKTTSTDTQSTSMSAPVRSTDMNQR
jgi:hypothetical protein